MTRPMGPIYLILVVGIAVIIALPFGRRDDWMGTAAFIVTIVANLIFGTMMIMGVVRSILEKWSKGDSDTQD
ncbi:hypothetical protein HOV93_31370 [Planctomycetes bacterium FF15]|uniref:Uncharacterized protein n=1 Tax=Bremerella alba TaxID=980252 RepID=A0A7V8V6U3_9BACT|nr:hypothetical protein [Bremerella alba]